MFTLWINKMSGLHLSFFFFSDLVLFSKLYIIVLSFGHKQFFTFWIMTELCAFWGTSCYSWILKWLHFKHTLCPFSEKLLVCLTKYGSLITNTMRNDQEQKVFWHLREKLQYTYPVHRVPVKRNTPKACDTSCPVTDLNQWPVEHQSHC